MKPSIALVVRSGAPDEWIVVADCEPNRNGRKYSPEILQRIAPSCRGLLVKNCDSGPVENLSLEDCVGICEEGRYANGVLACRFRWFSGKTPTGHAVTPAATAGRVTWRTPWE